MRSLGLRCLLGCGFSLCVACGGDTTGSTGVGGPGSGSGGTGTGGTSVGGSGAGGTSAGSAKVTFTVEPGHTFCTKGCTDGTPRLTLTTQAGAVVELGSLCQTDCSTCTFGLCPPIACAPPSQVTQGQLDWDGHYFRQSQCGNGVSCLAAENAPPGTYTATFCATPGYMSGPDGGFTQECVQTGPEECVTVQFQFPADRPVNGVLGKPVPIGR